MTNKQHRHNWSSWFKVKVEDEVVNSYLHDKKEEMYVSFCLDENNCLNTKSKIIVLHDPTS